jgi:hypothetical protein
MSVMVQLCLRPAPGVADASVRALLGPDWNGQGGLDQGTGPHDRWLLFRITGIDRLHVADKLALSALASGLVAEAEIRTTNFGKGFASQTRKVARQEDF